MVIQDSSSRARRVALGSAAAALVLLTGCVAVPMEPTTRARRWCIRMRRTTARPTTAVRPTTVRRCISNPTGARRCHWASTAALAATAGIGAGRPGVATGTGNGRQGPAAVNGTVLQARAVGPCRVRRAPGAATFHARRPVSAAGSPASKPAAWAAAAVVAAAAICLEWRSAAGA